MCGVLILREHTCSSVELTIKTVGLMSNIEYVKYSSLLNIHFYFTKEMVVVNTHTT